MTITIDWENAIINIPRADLTLVQSNPTEIRELDINEFRLTLKALEASEEGMGFQKTHDHSPEVTVSGVTIARVVIILDPYTITFEDGQYAVNLVNANSNIADRVNVNQVSVRSANSAGLAYVSGIISMEYQGRVCYDHTSPYSGTVYPKGTLRQPLNNINDVMLLANYRGFKKIYVMSDITIDGSVDVSNMTFIGESKDIQIIINDTVSSVNVSFENCNVSGVLDGNTTINDCYVGSIEYLNGEIRNSGLYGLLICDGNKNVVISNCYSIDEDNPPIIDMGGSGNDLAMPNYSGIVTITNLTSDDDEVGIGILSGAVILSSTITGGKITVSGNGILIDNSTGTATVNSDSLINVEMITKATWDTVYLYEGSGNTDISFPTGTSKAPADNLSDAIAICVQNNIHRINFIGDITLNQDINGYYIYTESPHNSSITLTSTDISNCIFAGAKVYGDMNGHYAQFYNSEFPNGLSNVNTNMENCILKGTFTVYTSGIGFNSDRCTSQDGVIIDGGGTGKIGFANFSGIINIQNLTDPSAVLGVTGYYLLTIESTCTAGNALVTGNGITINNGTMILTDRTMPSAVWEEQLNGHLNNGSVGLAVKKILGLSQENMVIDSYTFDGDGKVNGFKVKIYTDNTKNTLLESYTVTATRIGSKPASYEQLSDT